MTAEPSTERAPVEMQRAFMELASRTQRLFSLADGTVEILTILHALQEDNPDEPELVARLAEVETFLSDKLEACGVVVHDLTNLAAARKAEADRLRDQAKRLEEVVDHIRLRVRDHMLAVGDTKVVTPRYTIALTQNPPRVEVLEEALIPQEFKKTVVSTSIDKRAILQHLKDTGQIVDGVNVVREQRVDFR